MAGPDAPQSGSEQRLAERYGRRAVPSPRRAVWAAVVAVPIAVALCWWLWVALARSTPDLTWQLIGFDVMADTSVEVRWTVDRDPSLAVDCVLRARDIAGEEVGRDRVTVPTGGGERAEMTWPLRTSGRPVTGEVLTCVEGTG